MSFCRITGSSRSLPKPNYFPLLAPISPADARRYCRITGKSYGLPSHHFIPVILTTFSNRSKCRITNSTEYGPHSYGPDINYGNRKHVVLADYRYVFPVFDESNDKQRDLIDLLNSKTVQNETHGFVYSVDEQKCRLVFGARLEAAVRDGDVRDVMLAKNSDSVLLKMKKGQSVSLDLHDMKDDGALFQGEGPREEVLLEREMAERSRNKNRPKRKENLLHMANIFEGKERDADEELLKTLAIKEAKRQKIQARLADRNRKIEYHEFNAEMATSSAKTQLYLAGDDWHDLVKPVIESWDWDTYEKEASQQSFTPIVGTLPAPCDIKADIIRPNEMQVNDVVIQNTIGFDALLCVIPLSPCLEQPKADVIEAIKKIDAGQLGNLIENVQTDKQLLQALPTLDEISILLKNFDAGTIETVNKVQGLSLDIGTARKLFISGEMVSTPSGDVFVAGQTVQTPSGPVYVPGLAVNTPSGPSFIPGVVLSNSNDPETPVFIAGHIVNDHFVAGQTLHTSSGPKFVEGQTVVTPDGLKFVTGIVEQNTQRFVAGQTLATPDGPIFVPGQTITTTDGEQFLAGQSTFNAKHGWTFTPGQIISEQFVAGKSVITSEGAKFVAGQYENDTFVPGVTRATADGGMEFVPGLNVETKQGAKFVAGQMVQSAHGDIFMPGKSVVSKSGMINFAVAKTINDIAFSEPTAIGIVIDAANMEATTPSLSVYGHMVQTKKGIEFYPDKIDIAHLPEGKIIAGKLIRQDADTKFVPGIMENGGFIPGQVVWTESGEQFVAGQVIETAEGLKFVPGRVIETKSGSKFVCGQTVETPDGPRFIPGQIVHTKAGPTFIPGQVIYTEDEGERFVPGQVVDTPDGPRFVPAKVVETGDKVTFIPAQIVQTDEGPRFVAPDLCNDENGEQKFSVQSFLVSPEELTLLKPSHTWTTTANSNGELSIDAQMLRQLSEAGMTIGRQIETSAVEFVLQSTKDMQAVKKLAQKWQIGDDNEKVDVLEQLFAAVNKMVSAVQQKTENGVLLQEEMRKLLMNGSTHGFDEHKLTNGMDNHSQSLLTNGYHHPSTIHNGHGPTANGTSASYDLVNILSASVLQCVASSMAPTQFNACPSDRMDGGQQQLAPQSLYEIISRVFESHLASEMAVGIVNSDGAAHAHSNHTAPLFSAISELLSSPTALQALESHVSRLTDRVIQISKVDLIKSTISKNIYNDAEIVQNICVALDQEADMIETVRTLSENEPKLLYRIITNLKKDLDGLQDDKSTMAALKRSVIAAVKESAVNEINSLLAEATNAPDSREHRELNLLLMETAAMATALGLNDMCIALTAALGRADAAKVLLRDDNVMEMVQRVVVMKKIASNDSQLKQSMLTLHTHPFEARKDPNIRMLLRRSGVCTIDPLDKINIADSHEVPISLFCSDNHLAMEDFLIRHETKARGAFLIMKEGLQAVVPRESSRDVLTGKCAYTVLDEHGIRHFEPLHVFSALKMHVPSSSHRFSIYSCDVASDDLEVKSVLSAVSDDVADLILLVDKAKWNDENTESFNKRRPNLPCAKDHKVNYIVTDFRSHSLGQWAKGYVQRCA